MGREFHIDRPFVASGGSVLAGRRYGHGEAFDWRKAGVSENDLWDLWIIGVIDNAAPGVASQSPRPASRPAQQNTIPKR
jgi:hypothetical protein